MERAFGRLLAQSGLLRMIVGALDHGPAHDPVTGLESLPLGRQLAEVVAGAALFSQVATQLSGDLRQAGLQAPSCQGARPSSHQQSLLLPGLRCAGAGGGGPGAARAGLRGAHLRILCQVRQGSLETLGAAQRQGGKAAPPCSASRPGPKRRPPAPWSGSDDRSDVARLLAAGAG